MNYYKFLDADQTGRHSRKRLPIGEWITIEGPLAMCANGIHVTTIEHALEWLDERAHPVEIRGEHLVGDTKVCCREVFIHPAIPEWNERTRCLFAADCAERVLHLFEEAHPNDDRPRKAIEAARAFARGEILADAMFAARDAARAARDAARSAESRWQTERLAEILEARTR